MSTEIEKKKKTLLADAISQTCRGVDWSFQTELPIFFFVFGRTVSVRRVTQLFGLFSLYWIVFFRIVKKTSSNIIRRVTLRVLIRYICTFCTQLITFPNRNTVETRLMGRIITDLCNGLDTFKVHAFTFWTPATTT